MSEDDARPLHRGSGGGTYIKESAQHGKPQGVIGDDQTGRPRGRGRAPWGGGEVRSTAEAG